MKYILLTAASLLLLPFMAFGNDCHGHWDRTKYAHCTEFADAFTDAVGERYQMQFIKMDGKRNVLVDLIVCVSSLETVYQFAMKNAPGYYTYLFNMAHDVNGHVFYEPYASQTFYHSGQGPAYPDLFTVHLNPPSNAVRC